jgi:DMSO/TMAO reductase YedYZ molybdopterin-dependent catalytic subunit
MPFNSETRLTRRQWLAKAIVAGGSLLSGVGLLGCNSFERRMSADSFAGGKLIGDVRFANESDLRLDTPLWTELDGRLYHDISTLTSDDLVTPTEKFYIRTRASQLLSSQKRWSIRMSGFGRLSNLSMKEIATKSKPLGLQLMECAGNSRSGHFGLISVADWIGVPLLNIFEHSSARLDESRIRLSGFDTYSTKSLTSISGASWIFSFKDLEISGAFLATHMNGLPLVLDHGAPVRLVVPGWYGCACIKWVNEIALVEDSSAATSQMQEYANRTHQNGVPVLASEYEPATIDPAAVPIRVEKWIVDGRVKYRIVGIVWGGSAIAKSLNIRLDRQDEAKVKLIYPLEKQPWAIWTHAWRPPKVGDYEIRMTIGDLGVRTRRLDSGFYTRTVRILDV